MKTSKLIFGAAVILLAGSMTLTSCHKKTKTEEQPDNETATANDNANMENISSDVDAVGGEVSENGSLSQYRTDGTNAIELSPTATVTGFGTSTITVDFGTVGCVGADNRTRTGKIIYDLSQCTRSTAIHYRNPGFKMIVTSQNYVVDGNAVSIINKTIQNTSPTSINGESAYSGTNLTWHITSDISVVKAGGGTVTWNCDRTKTLLNTNDANCYHGQLIPITWSMAKVQISGSASGVNAKGENYTVTATNMVRDFTCSPSANYPKRHPFISGTMDYKPGSRPTRHIDYGNGACDFSALVTVNGVTYSINLP
jgi:hypothetical protein